VLPDVLPLRLTIDRAALADNWRWLATMSGRAACGAAVKADGYGLGAVEAVRVLAEAGCRDFFVASWAEAAALDAVADGGWPEGLSLSVLHGLRAEDMPAALASRARPVLNSVEQVARWRSAAPERPCDVMVDTGMNRLGLTPEQARSGLLDGLAVDTLLSHLACADEPNHALNERQLFAFRTLKGLVPARRYSLANSAGVCLGQRFAFGLTRPGLALYGGVPVPGDAVQEAGIRSVARIEAQVLQLRDVPAGLSIGYGATHVSPGERIAILNIGYADGYLRGFSGTGIALADGKPLPVVGRVSMDLIAVRVDGADVAEGDWIGIDYRLPEAARRSGLSQYELLTGLGHRYQRLWT